MSFVSKVGEIIEAINALNELKAALGISDNTTLISAVKELVVAVKGEDESK
ncbi:hypothetical protein VPH49_22065 [Pseudomonas luteola]|uniref:hypothetical protein n=1 Tax=Pseudomonas luteola TaxID=47886 RepID=UPI003A896E61